ncbi:hypothetical protein [Thalassospira profundimaris]|uniref:hypothetical protein n=1 Tax=Thalassospira profundimaris TaxID=502049 RepID=UPI000DEE005B|nr:hypothetical protein [Thalassospira profundimaris]
MSSEKKIKLSKLYLDNENPRHDPIDNEPEIIQYLLDKQSVKPLAKHIASKGRISPLEKIGVVPHGRVAGAYVAAEGNRRTCALKLLGDPDKAPKESDKKFFRKLKSEMSDPIVELDVVVFEDEDEAEPWVSLRHEGEQGGVGTKPWNPEQQARFHTKKGGATNPNLQSLMLLEYALVKELITKPQADGISLTTVTRFLSNPEFRQTLGLVDNKSLIISVPQNQFDNVVKRFLLDALADDDEKKKVHSRTSAEQRREYAKQLREEGVAPTIREPENLDVRINADIKPSDNPKDVRLQGPATRNNRSPDLRHKVVPANFRVSITDPILKRLYDELRLIDPNVFSFSSAYLVRAVIERSSELFVRQRYGSAPPELHRKIGKVVAILLEDGVDERELKVWRIMANDKESRYSPESIGHFVHGGAVPTKTDLIRTWDSVQSVLAMVFDRLR